MAEPAALWERDAVDLAAAVRSGEVRAADLLELHLHRIDEHDPKLNAMAHLDVDGARRQAEAVDARVEAGDDPGPLAGVPMGVKELTAVGGMPDTGASKIYEGRTAAADCAEVARLRAAGAVIVGLTTAPEFGAVSFTNTPLHGVTRNPWDPSRTPGGSSGGSAAAVASGMLPACTGSDGGGSIRIPASYSGLLGMKATFGRIGAGPGAPFDSSLTSVHGPMVRSVRDAARYLDVTAGPTATDPLSLAAPSVSYEQVVASGAGAGALRRKRVAWSSSLGYARVDPDVERVSRDAALVLVERAGWELVDVDVRLPRPGSAWGLLSALNMAAFHADDAQGRFDELTPVVRLGFEALGRLDAAGLGKAVRRRQELLDATAAAWEHFDFLLTPTTPTTAIVAEGALFGEVAGEQVNLMLLSAAFTAPFNMTGQPACSVPAGFVDGLPVGVQVVGRRHEDALVLSAAALLEEARPWPRLAAGY